MKKFIIKTLALLLIITLALSVCACDVKEEELNLQADDELAVFVRGTQTLTVVASQEAENPTKFKSNINKNAIALKGYLSKKKVEAVEYVDETTIKVTLSGETEDFEDEWDVGMLIVKAWACTNDKNCYTYVKVYNIYMSVKIGDSRPGEIGDAYSEYTTIFTLNNGAFSTDFNPQEDITLIPYANFDAPSPSVNGKFTARIIDVNRLIIRINFVDTSISRYPKIKIAAGLIEGSEEMEFEIGLNSWEYGNIIL